MNQQTLCDIAREQRTETLRAAESARRERLVPSQRDTWRARLAAAFTATGETLVTLGQTLNERSE